MTDGAAAEPCGSHIPTKCLTPTWAIVEFNHCSSWVGASRDYASSYFDGAGCRDQGGHGDGAIRHHHYP